MTDELCFATVSELAKALRRKRVSAVELTRMFLARLERIGPKYNALAELTPDRALAQARRADRLLKQGATKSPLVGIPYGAKDLLATKGIPTRWGAPPYRDQVLDYDATVIRRLDEAGAVLIGKLAMVELAGGGGYAYPSASLHGPGLNPWNTDHWSGGSSSGSGSAVAAGLVPFALGSETWGSIMSPSSNCGISGLRPTRGRVSRYGAMELAWTMDKIGPMAHTAEDCGWVLEAIAGYDPHDPTTVERKFRMRLPPSQKAFDLGVLPADFSGEPEMEKVFEQGLRVLRRVGMRVRQAKLPDYDYHQVANVILDSEQAAAHRDLIKSEKLNELVDADQKEGLRKSSEIPAADYVLAEQERRKLTRDVLALFSEYDALLSPTTVAEAVSIETNLKARPRKRGNYSFLGSLCGVPCLTVPMGFGRHGLPFGLAITGNLLAENTILQIGILYQRETDWHMKHPAVVE